MGACQSSSSSSGRKLRVYCFGHTCMKMFSTRLAMLRVTYKLFNCYIQ